MSWSVRDPSVIRGGRRGVRGVGNEVQTRRRCARVLLHCGIKVIFLFVCQQSSRAIVSAGNENEAMKWKRSGKEKIQRDFDLTVRRAAVEGA